MTRQPKSRGLPTVPVGIRMPEPLRDILDAEAEAHGVTRSVVLVRWLEDQAIANGLLEKGELAEMDNILA